MATQVSVVTAASGAVTFYSTMLQQEQQPVQETSFRFGLI